jgi:hypothetical protein
MVIFMMIVMTIIAIELKRLITVLGQGFHGQGCLQPGVIITTVQKSQVMDNQGNGNLPP